jgi:hypothetical protein
MGTEKERDGFDRRQFLRRAAVAGAAAAWTAPVVKSVIGTPAFAQGVSGTPKDEGKDLSYVVVFYTCTDTPPGEYCAVKWDIDTGAEEVGDFSIPECGDRSGGTCGDPDHFIFSGNGTSASVSLSEAGMVAGCSIYQGMAKCGSSQSTSNPCVPGVGGGNFMSFSGCGTQPPAG